MFSIVCPTYNSSQYIDRCLKSILNQTYLPKEVIISDDGSTDNTIQLVKNYNDKFLSKSISLIIIEGDHNGPGEARNKGIYKAKENWISFIDSDDDWENNKLLKVYNYITNNNSINAVLHWENYIKLDGTISKLPHGINFVKDESLKKQLYNENFFSTSALTIKRKLLINCNGFDNSFPNWQDYELWLRISDKIKLGIIKEVLGSYYEISSSITNRPYWKKIKSNLRVWFRYKQEMDKKIILSKLLKIVFSKSWLYDLKKIFRWK